MRHDDNMTVFDPEEIELCLNCTKPECTNCLDQHYRTTYEKVILDGELLVRLYNQGYTLRYMGKKLGVHWSTLSKRLNAYGLPATLPRKQITKDTLMALPSHQRQMLTWKGECLA